MAKGPAHAVCQHIHHLAAQHNSQATDRELLQRFSSAQDQCAFEALFRRHGGMVLAVARRVLGNSSDAEDVCQATFLLLAKKAGSQRWQPTVASWLFKTAHQLALKARTAAARRARREGCAVPRSIANPLAEITGLELLAVLDEELLALPEVLRAPLVLCYLQGATRDEAAQCLGCPLGTLKNRLERGREQLQAAMVRRGLDMSVALLGTLLTEQSASGAESIALAGKTAEAALTVAAGRSLDGTVSSAVSQLLKGGAPIMCWNRFKAALILLLAGGLLSTAVALGFSAGEDGQTGAAAKQPPASSDSAAPRPAVGQARALGATLRYRFKKDVRLRYVVERKIESDTDANTGNKTVRTTESYDVTWKVVGVDNEGNAKMTLTIDRVRYQSDQHFPGKLIEFDSKKHKNPAGLSGPVRLLSPILRAQVGAVFTCIMSPRGEIRDFKVPKKLADTVKKTRGMSGQYSRENLQQTLAVQGSVVLPSEPLSRGASWNEKSEWTVAGGHARMPVQIKAIYQGEAERGGKKLETIALEPTATKVERSPTTKLGPFTLKTHKGKGSMSFDKVSGWLVEAEQYQVVEMVSGPGPGQMLAWKIRLSLSAKLVGEK
jgi:RNA polymerase sigma factor (sigma-70 family)